jgi:hypothetical protein
MGASLDLELAWWHPMSWSYCSNTAASVTKAPEPIGSHLLEDQAG